MSWRAGNGRDARDRMTEEHPLRRGFGESLAPQAILHRASKMRGVTPRHAADSGLVYGLV